MRTQIVYLLKQFKDHLNQYVELNCDPLEWVDLPKLICKLCETTDISVAEFTKCVNLVNKQMTSDQIAMIFNDMSLFSLKKIGIDELRIFIKNDLSENQHKALLYIYDEWNAYCEDNMCANDVIYKKFNNDVDLTEIGQIRKQITFNDFKNYNAILLCQYENTNRNFELMIHNEWSFVNIGLRTNIMKYKLVNTELSQSNVKCRRNITQVYEINRALGESKIKLETNIIELETKILDLEKKILDLEKKILDLKKNILDLEMKILVLDRIP